MMFRITFLLLLTAAMVIPAISCSSGGGVSSVNPVIAALTIPTTANINDEVTLSVTASDPGGLTLTYLWSATTGTFSDPAASTTTWTAPAASVVDLEINVKVTNSKGNSVTGTATITVLGPGGTVEDAVRAIVSANCARCHVAKPASHTGSMDIGNCGSCHRPYGNTTAFEHTALTSGCTSCHTTPEATHFFLRDDSDLSLLAPDAVDQCIACHRDNGAPTFGAGTPPLDTDDAIMDAALNGTLRSWIQPGGYMNKYLTGTERTTITNWIDSISDNRILGYNEELIAVQTADFDPNGLGDNDSWDLAPEHMVNVDSTLNANPGDVKLQALYSETYLYIRAEYNDSTLSMTRGGSWIYEGGTNWRNPSVSTGESASEDRFAVLWNMNIPDFQDRYGCAMKCHGNQAGTAAFSDLPGSIGDIWHAKAGRGMGLYSAVDNGAMFIDTGTESFEATSGFATFAGSCDDKWLIWYMDTADGFGNEDGGRRGDSGSSAYGRNRNDDKSGPDYMETNPDSWADAMALTDAEVDAGLLDGSVIVADPTSIDYDAAEVALAWANYVALGAVVPERRLQVPTESRGDVGFWASWENGVWVIELKRALITGNSDDVQFNLGTSSRYGFSFSIFDNGPGGEIPPGHITYGDNQYQVLVFQ